MKKKPNEEENNNIHQETENVLQKMQEQLKVLQKQQNKSLVIDYIPIQL